MKHNRYAMNIFLALLVAMGIFGLVFPVALLSLPPSAIRLLQVLPSLILQVALFLWARMIIRKLSLKKEKRRPVRLFFDFLLSIVTGCIILGIAFDWPFIIGICNTRIDGAGMRMLAVVTMIYSVVTISLIFGNRLKITTVEAIFYSSVPLIVIMLDALFFTNTFFFGISVSTSALIIYFLIQSRHFSYDQLTGLRNREAFLNEFEKSIDRNLEGSIILLDLKDFRFLNQKFGQVGGDELLQAVASYLLVEVGERYAFRFGGDQFAIIQYHSNIEDALQATNVLLKRFEEPWAAVGSMISLEVHSALVFFPEHVKTIEEAVNAIAFTLTEAKASHGDALTIYDTKALVKAKRKQDVAEALKRYMQLEQPLLFFQPVFRIATGTMYSAEALLRINDPELGSISPVEFIPIAEQNGMIVELTYRIIQEVCELWKLLGEETGGLERIMVNLSSIHFLYDDMAQRIAAIITESGIQPSRIGFELTESMVVESFDRVERVMLTLTDLGCSFYLDDYGTGYSNIEYLMKLPFETVKLDRSIIIHYVDHAQVLESVVSMLQKINKRIVAEGVESEDQLVAMKRLHVDFVQGFLFSKPMAMQNFMNLVKSGILKNNR
ncbi:bifunctional diguanylate cyclase/phosphodiesterase [uncultured Sphaerochaeta sp.]|uniref:putative bifunctional diguanylate cyclase/phosphodiesterase n=1 Tax=uncultured Sphaerochaeta sp. TaxID=886478 RepID=UPI002A0A34D7|nr:bifunctional diguanylate cyclase/phosphodiesterase [uncultured Sphaerochaeta sp.]